MLAACILRWRSTLCNINMIAINGTPIVSIKGITSTIETEKVEPTPTLLILVVPQEHVNVKLDIIIPKIHFDQMNIMAYQYHAENHNTPAWFDPCKLPPANNAIIF